MTTPILINGNYPDWSSVAIKARGRLIHGVQAITYKNAVQPGTAEGAGSQSIGRTRGKHTADGDMTMLLPHFYELIDVLAPKGSGKGYMDETFLIQVQIQENPFPIRTDELPGVRIIEDPFDGKHGGEALLVKVKLSIPYIVKDGRMPLANMRR